jgi:hypothetical protein
MAAAGFDDRDRNGELSQRLNAASVWRSQPSMAARRLPCHRNSKKAKPPSPAALPESAKIRSLFELGRDARELIVELAAEAIDHGDDRNRNARGNQAIFDRGSPRIVLQERNKF